MDTSTLRFPECLKNLEILRLMRQPMSFNNELAIERLCSNDRELQEARYVCMLAYHFEPDTQGVCIMRGLDVDAIKTALEC